MNADIAEWLNLAIRWLHLTAGIAWIGSSFYFIWLDNHLKPVAAGEASGELWAVHGGGFYHNQKYLVAPSQMPDNLHWFKWESYFTWISGFSLLVLIYYGGAKNFLIDPGKAQLGVPTAIAIGLGFLVGGWLIYDALCRSALKANKLLFGSVWFGVLLAAAIALDALFNARAAYIHVGAIIGTVMVANVFLIIIPNQRKVVAALVAGETPDPALGQAAKLRSLHNNYMTLPVLFIMISPHYPMTYGADRPWLVLALIGLTGVAIRHAFNLRHRGKVPFWILALIAGLAIASMSYVALEKDRASGQDALSGSNKVSFADIQPILVKHCSSCHGAQPTDPAFPSPPLGVALDSFEHARSLAARIKSVTVDSEIMPLGNVTGMTKAERDMLGQWIAQGTPQ
jgi:uncharacterized membrane protein